jgi:hypothetical protein
VVGVRGEQPDRLGGHAAELLELVREVRRVHHDRAAGTRENGGVGLQVAAGEDADGHRRSVAGAPFVGTIASRIAVKEEKRVYIGLGTLLIIIVLLILLL